MRPSSFCTPMKSGGAGEGLLSKSPDERRGFCLQVIDAEELRAEGQPASWGRKKIPPGRRRGEGGFMARTEEVEVLRFFETGPIEKVESDLTSSRRRCASECGSAAGRSPSRRRSLVGESGCASRRRRLRSARPMRSHSSL